MSAAQIFSRLANLPVTITERCIDGSLNLWAIKGGECEHGAPSHGWFVTARQQYCG